ncbi:vitamin D 25-hydroxylase [Petromyzon marinus]|uniref:vitamin D 25-hydroxylase n=1 Tax=Petromyzon marinus TaxID=7757 RepID=UPI003F72350F
MACHLAEGPGQSCPAPERLPAAASPPSSLGLSTLSVALLLLLLLALRLWRGSRRLPEGFPPGPRALPLVGNLLSLGEQPHVTLTELASQHGAVYSVWLATIPAVVVCGYEAVRECLQLRATDFADRPCLPLFQRLTGMRGLLNARFGPGWAEQRRLAVWSVHAFGTAKPNFESLLQEECAHLLEAMDKAFEAADTESSSSSSSHSSSSSAAAASRSPTANASSSCDQSSSATACASLTPSKSRKSSDASPPQSSSSSTASPSSSPPPPKRDPSAAAAGGIDPGPLITSAVSNVTNLVIFGERFEYGDTEFESMVQMFSENVALAASAWSFLYSAFPRLVGALPFGSHRRLFANAERVRECLVSLTGKFSRGRVPGEPRHMVDAYLDQVDAAEEAAALSSSSSSRTMASGSPETPSSSSSMSLSRLSPPLPSSPTSLQPPSSSPPSSPPPSSSPTSSTPPPPSSFTRDNMIFTIGELFIAGTETSSNTLRWAILYMCLYPELQDDLHAELTRALRGECRALRLSDRARTPLLEATLHEVLRHATIAPLGIFRAATRDVSFRGFAVPRGTVVVANLHSAHRDPGAWTRAHEFLPRRFLDADGRFVRRKAFVAFSIGRRHCVGEKLALMELFLFLASMLHRFRFSLAGGGAPDLRPRLGFTLQPRPYRVNATRR